MASNLTITIIKNEIDRHTVIMDSLYPQAQAIIERTNGTAINEESFTLVAQCYKISTRLCQLHAALRKEMERDDVGWSDVTGKCRCEKFRYFGFGGKDH